MLELAVGGGYDRAQEIVDRTVNTTKAIVRGSTYMFMRPSPRMSLVLCLTSLLFAKSTIVSATRFLGPTPYLSAADSPFPVDGSDLNFFLEDFEDGLLNTPGIEIDSLDFPPFSGIVGPGPTTDSVDGDDGTIDGCGVEGHAIRRRMGPDFSPDPIFSSRFDIEFSRDELGFLPNSFGFAWTDGLPSTGVNIAMFDEDMNPIDGISYTDLGDTSDTGETGEDRFLGLVTDQPFQRVSLIIFFQSQPNTPRDLVTYTEIDHVQYGLLVPEPSSVSLCILMVVASFWRPRI